MKLTRTFTYLVPILNTEVEILYNLVQNAYVGVETINKTFDGNIYCHFKYDSEHLAYEKYLFEHKLYKTHLDLEDNTYIVGFEFPKKYYKNVYCNFVEGSYSKFPDIAKKLILNFHNLSKSSLQCRIMYKDRLLYKEKSEQLNCFIPYSQEIGDLPIFENECYYFNNNL